MTSRARSKPCVELGTLGLLARIHSYPFLGAEGGTTTLLVWVCTSGAAAAAALKLIGWYARASVRKGPCVSGLIQMGAPARSRLALDAVSPLTSWVWIACMLWKCGASICKAMEVGRFSMLWWHAPGELGCGCLHQCLCVPLHRDRTSNLIESGLLTGQVWS